MMIVRKADFCRFAADAPSGLILAEKGLV